METIYRRHANGCIAEVANYSKGRPSESSADTLLTKGRRHGTTTWFYANGNLERVAEFWYDQLHGDYYEFWPNGKRAVRAQYVYGAQEELEEYDESGRPITGEKTEEAEVQVRNSTRQDVRHPRSSTSNSRRGQPRNPMRRSSEHHGCSDCTEDDGAW